MPFPLESSPATTLFVNLKGSMSANYTIGTNLLTPLPERKFLFNP